MSAAATTATTMVKSTARRDAAPESSLRESRGGDGDGEREEGEGTSLAAAAASL